MDVVHTHNLNRDPAPPRPFGIRVTLPRQDTFAALLGTDWERLHWYATAEERDSALKDMSSEHLYSRRGDLPRLRYEAVERPLADSSDPAFPSALARAPMDTAGTNR